MSPVAARGLGLHETVLTKRAGQQLVGRVTHEPLSDDPLLLEPRTISDSKHIEKIPSNDDPTWFAGLTKVVGLSHETAHATTLESTAQRYVLHQRRSVGNPAYSSPPAPRSSGWRPGPSRPWTGQTPWFYRSLPPAEHPAGQRETNRVKGYVVRKGNQHYAVIYEGLDPITGRERRRWHPAGPDRAVAEALAHRLADDRLRDRRRAAPASPSAST